MARTTMFQHLPFFSIVRKFDMRNQSKMSDDVLNPCSQSSIGSGSIGFVGHTCFLLTETLARKINWRWTRNMRWNIMKKACCPSIEIFIFERRKKQKKMRNFDLWKFLKLMIYWWIDILLLILLLLQISLSFSSLSFCSQKTTQSNKKNS